jgi:hypothetical protein
MRKINFDGLVLAGNGRAYLDHDVHRGSYYAEVLWDREGSRYRAIWLVDDWKLDNLDPEDCCDWQNPDRIEYLGD